MSQATLAGYVRTIVVDRGFGFISETNGPDYFFHCRDLDDELEFGEQLKGRRVKFHAIHNTKGGRAVSIQAAD